MTVEQIPWPPAYIVKKNKRARHVRLRASKQKGLEITVPERFNMHHVQIVLENNKSWIIKKLLALGTQSAASLPSVIDLTAISERWTVKYISVNARLRLFVRPDFEVVVLGKLDPLKVKKILIIWLKKVAKVRLQAMFNLVSQQTALFYHRLIIRDQQSRWGSCSSEKHISLNYKLLFLPLHLTRHVMIHELCHTVFLNHSDKFWQLVAKFDHNWQAHRQQLRQGEEFIPLWTSIDTLSHQQSS